MPETADLRNSILTVFVADSHLHNFEVLLGGAKEQVEVAKGVKVAKIPAVDLDVFVVAPVERFGAAKRILEALPQQERKKTIRKIYSPANLKSVASTNKCNFGRKKFLIRECATKKFRKKLYLCIQQVSENIAYIFAKKNSNFKCKVLKIKYLQR
jgi:hypothetical protein